MAPRTPSGRNRRPVIYEGGIGLGGGVTLFRGSGAPTNGTSGTGVGYAGPGSFYIRTSNGAVYVNTNTLASPTWSQVGSIAALTDAHIFVGNAGNVGTDVAVSGDATMANSGAVTVVGVNGSATARTGAQINLLAAGVAAGYKIARGEHTQVAASDTVVTGLTTVVAVVVSPRTPTVKQLLFGASIGDQAGTPAAGSILITSYKPTAVDNVTPAAATDFTDNIKVNWVAIGT